MLKAIHGETGKEIIVLQAAWVTALEQLRSLDKKDALLCPGCRQPVRVRAGEERQWHFAHKSLADCPLQNESFEVLRARAILYTWLEAKFTSAKSVTLEQSLDSPLLSRPVDCWVETDRGPVAYWILDKQEKPQNRDELLRAFQRAGSTVHWVFLADLLRVHGGSPDRLLLSTTERDLMQACDYDRIGTKLYEEPGKTLHYLDIKEETLTTFRGLRLVHAPHMFSGRNESHVMWDISVNPENGEFVHPGETDRLIAWQRGKEEYDKRSMGNYLTGMKRHAGGEVSPAAPPPRAIAQGPSPWEPVKPQPIEPQTTAPLQKKNSPSDSVIRLPHKFDNRAHRFTIVFRGRDGSVLDYLFRGDERVYKAYVNQEIAKLPAGASGEVMETLTKQVTYRIEKPG
jgi:hypothetical protein